MCYRSAFEICNNAYFFRGNEKFLWIQIILNKHFYKFSMDSVGVVFGVKISEYSSNELEYAEKAKFSHFQLACFTWSI